MKTKTLKKTIHIIAVCLLILATAIITKNTFKNIAHLYSNEKNTNTAMTCFADLIY